MNPTSPITPQSPVSDHAARITHHAATGSDPSQSTQSPIPNHQSAITRYLSIYAALWKNSVAREMIFKSNFLLWIFVELLWFGLQLSFIGVLYLHTEQDRKSTRL